MSGTNPCPRCGAELPPGMATDDCPRCLLAAGLESAAGPAASAAGGGDAAAGAKAPRAAPTAPSPEEIGKHFPQLEVLELLGQGGMGIVYKARQRSLDRLVALKVLPPDVAREPGFAERFTREARTLARLQHANIVGVHDFGESDGLYYLLMEYVDGANLREAMRTGHLRPAQALAIVPQICDALQYAHENGVVHRDVKPENILLDRAGRVRIADFGLAKIVQRSPVDVTLTRAGQVMGTLHYMAPEQYRTPDSVDHRADIYSLGVVLYEMLTGELPLGSFPAPSEKSGVDVRIDRVVMRALERERDRRWQHAADMKTRVSEIAAGPDVAAAPPPTPGEAKGAKVVDLPGIRVTKSADGSHVQIGGRLVEGAGTFRVGPDGQVAPSRPSVLATLGGLGVPAAILLGAVVWAVAASSGAASPFRAAASVGMFVVGLGCLVSLIAWIRIHHSGGKLSGKGWAVTGTFLPLAFLCCMPVVVWPMAGLSVTEGPDGKTVEMPFLRVHKGPDGELVEMPGLHVDTRGGSTRVEVSSAFVEDEDEARAERVTGGPESLSEDDRAAVAAAMRILWEKDGERVLGGRKLEIDGRSIRPRDLGFFHMALGADGRTGRLVLAADDVTIVATANRNDQGWALGDGFQMRNRAPTDADRDGDLDK